MSPEEFRRAGHRAVDWIADYFTDPDRFPVLPDVKPGDLIDALPPAGPERPEPIDAVFADFERLIVPGMTLWNHPAFMAYFAVSGSPPGILGELLASTLNVNHMLWKSGPAATELEQVTLDWVRQWLGLPEGLFGIIYDTASISTMHALAAAREQADPECRSLGGSRDLIVYTSEQAHSSVEKGAISIGMGQRNVRKIAVDDAFAMKPAALREAIRRDREAGLRPCCVVPSIGTTSTTAIDPIADVADIAESEGLWMHVDGAYGGSAALLPEFRPRCAGWERADSIVVNPHKWMLTPVDISVFYTRKPDILRRAFSLVPEYLRTAEDPRAVNLMDYGVQLGRRFRSLKLWFVMRSYGREGLQRVIRGHLEMAQALARRIEAHPQFELAAPVPLGLVCFRYRGTDEQNRALLDKVNATREAFLSHTVLNGRFTLRLAIGNFQTTQRHVDRAWELVEAASREL